MRLTDAAFLDILAALESEFTVWWDDGQWWAEVANVERNPPTAPGLTPQGALTALIALIRQESLPEERRD
jgi:hypothetical protein